jgi:hypothetical protein
LTPSTSGISRIAPLRVRNLSSAVLQQEIRILQILAGFNSETRKRSITISVYDFYKRSDWNMLRVWPPLCQCHSDVLHERGSRCLQKYDERWGYTLLSYIDLDMHPLLVHKSYLVT